MIAPLYTSHTTPKVMPQFDIPNCSRCRQPKSLVKVLAHFPVLEKDYDILVQCVNDRCNWRDCKIHLTVSGAASKPTLTRPDLFAGIKPSLFGNKPQLFGATNNKPNLFGDE